MKSDIENTLYFQCKKLRLALLRLLKEAGVPFERLLDTIIKLKREVKR